MLAIAKRLGERVAKEIALGDDADEDLTVIVDDRQVTNPPQAHDVVGERELVVAFKGGRIAVITSRTLSSFILIPPKALHR